MQSTREAVTDTDGQRGRRCLTFAHHIEMGIETGNLINFGLRQAHFLGQGADVGGAEVAVGILNEMQKLDQEIAVARPVPQKRQDVAMCLIVELTPLGRPSPLALAGFPDALAIVQRCHADLHFAGAMPLGLPSAMRIVKSQNTKAQ